MKYLAENIKYLRNKLGLSQEKLAEMMGMNRGNIASYEKGMAEPRIENLLKLMTIFKVELNDLVKKDLRVLEKIDIPDRGLYRPGLFEQGRQFHAFLRRSDLNHILKNLLSVQKNCSLAHASLLSVLNILPIEQMGLGWSAADAKSCRPIGLPLTVPAAHPLS